MKKYLLLLAVAAFGLNCGGGATTPANNAAPANKPANATTPAPANKPAAPANSATPPSNSSAPSEKSETSNPDLDFTLVNKTGYDIKELSIGATGTGNWTKEDEVLKGKTFADDASLEIKFHPRATAEKWDIKVEWADGSPGVEWEGLKMTEIEKITLTYDRATNKTTANVE
jgi:hypothetical protein